MTKQRKIAIKIASVILTLMYIIWGICLINILSSCNKNSLYYTNGIIIDYENLNNGDKSRMYTESKTNYKVGDIIFVDNVYANIITKVIIENPINDYWYDIIFIGNSKKGVN